MPVGDITMPILQPKKKEQIQTESEVEECPKCHKKTLKWEYGTHCETETWCINPKCDYRYTST